MDNKLKIFVCRRGEEKWEGALIVGAENMEEATTICTEGLEYEPYKVREIPLIKGILYDDEMR